MLVQVILFSLITFGAFSWAGRQFYRIYQNIQLGRPDKISGNTGQRWNNVLLVAFGQRKMFNRPIPAIFHFFIYTAFLMTQVELVEILIDGFTGHHRFFTNHLGGFYTLVIGLIEILSALAFVATVIFLVRRNVLRLSRFWKAEMTRWPRLDANLILLGEILLVMAILTMNSADTVLQGLNPEHYPSTGKLPVSSWLGPLLFSGWSADSLVWIERAGWWTHVLVVYGFMIYLPYSKHLHIFLAFPNTWFAKLRSRGEMTNMPVIMQEVRSMLGLPVAASETPTDDSHQVFGANDITGLSWKTILDAYTCTECGRCTSVCPANLTGKKLSPRKVMMDIRDRTEDISQKWFKERRKYIKKDLPAGQSDKEIAAFDDGLTLFDRITPEEINACTTCNACVEACPVLIDPVEPILQLRRYQILMESKGPAEWVPMFNALESSGAVWQVPEARSKWTELVHKP